MLKNTPFASTPTYKLALGLGLCTLGGVMFYIYFKTRDDEDNIKDSTIQTDVANRNKARNTPSKLQMLTVRMDIPNEHVPIVVGRCGGQLNLIEDKSNTKIHFCDKNDTHKECIIVGDRDAITLARELMFKEIERSPIIKEELYLPQIICHQIMGCSGEVLREISCQSMAKISMDANVNPETGMKRLVIIGNRKQVNIAHKLIDDKISENKDLREAVEKIEQTRDPRRSPTTSMSSSLYSSQTSLNSQVAPRDNLLKAEESAIEVFVSAVASPSKFWLQLIGSQSAKLDQLVETMTDYYSVKENCDRHQIKNPQIGQIVTTIFDYDGKWYRAEILNILPDKDDTAQSVLDLYFVDYGDSAYVTPDKVYQLRTDFLSLRFQAVECYLANVKSTLNSACTWHEESISKFEELTDVAHWKKLNARLVAYKDNENPNNTTRHDRSPPTPGIELFDVIDGKEINVGEMLISLNLALPADEHRPFTPVFVKSGATTPTITPNISLHNSFTSNLNNGTSISTNGISNSFLNLQGENFAQQNNLTTKNLNFDGENVYPSLINVKSKINTDNVSKYNSNNQFIRDEVAASTLMNVKNAN